MAWRMVHLCSHLSYRPITAVLHKPRKNSCDLRESTTPARKPKQPRPSWPVGMCTVITDQASLSMQRSQLSPFQEPLSTQPGHIESGSLFLTMLQTLMVDVKQKAEVWEVAFPDSAARHSHLASVKTFKTILWAVLRMCITEIKLVILTKLLYLHFFQLYYHQYKSWVNLLMYKMHEKTWHS